MHSALSSAEGELRQAAAASWRNPEHTLLSFALSWERQRTVDLRAYQLVLHAAGEYVGLGLEWAGAWRPGARVEVCRGFCLEGHYGPHTPVQQQ